MNVAFLKSITQLGELPQSDLPHIAIVGRSNVGKSSLLNTLTKRKGLAFVSAKPGRTQTINLFDVDGRLLLVDLPGYGYAKTSKEQRQQFADLIRDYALDTKQLALVLLVIDAKAGLTERDKDLMALLNAGHAPFALIVNKMDKLSQSESVLIVRSLKKDVHAHAIIPHSNVTGLGHGELMTLIDEIAQRSKRRSS